MRIGGDFAWNVFDYLDACIHQRPSFVGIIRKKPNPADTKISQYRDRQAEIPTVGLESERMIRGNGIEALILEGVSARCLHLLRAKSGSNLLGSRAVRRGSQVLGKKPDLHLVRAEHAAYQKVIGAVVAAFLRAGGEQCEGRGGEEQASHGR